MPSNDFIFNPYQGVNFIQFILLFFTRLGLLLTGQLELKELASDDIQVLVLIGIALSSALVGSFLVLRRMTMLANSLAHTILMGIVLAYLFNQAFLSHHDTNGYLVPMGLLLLASLIMGFVTSFLTEFLTKTMRLQADASTGLVFSSLFALGIILVTVLTRNSHIGLEAVMGNADALHVEDLKWVYLILAINLTLFFLFFKEFKLTTFDSNLAYALGFSNAFFNYLLMSQVSITTIGAFRAVGVFLVLAFMTGPALTARLLTHDLKTLLIWASGIGFLASLCGVALTRHLLTVFGVALSTSGMVVCVISLFYLLALLLAPQQGFLAKLFYKRQLRLKNNERKVF